MHLKVVLPTGEVNVPVEPNSTPGMLKENLKYSIRVPPKFIRLTCNGQELDDIKPLVAEPNNLEDGSTVLCEKKDGAEVEEAEHAAREEAASRAASQPTVIKKEEPPKPKKARKDTVRPVLADGDVVKRETLAPGHDSWTPEFIEGKCAKRHLAFLKLESLEGERKCYPDKDDGAMLLALGDPHSSPVWTEAATQLDIGEKAVFHIRRKALDFDPEGLNPTDSCESWSVELLRIMEVQDVNQDFSVLFHVEESGRSERAQDLDRVQVHWRVRRWMAEGTFCCMSSRERIAILQGYGLVPIEDMNAPPVSISIGEGQQEAVELVASQVGPGGKGHVYLKSNAMSGNRPAGCVVVDVELVNLDANRGPGSSGWEGWTSIITERETGDQWLEEADGGRKRLETFSMLRKSTDDSKEAEIKTQDQVHKYANNAARRYRRALGWLEKDQADDKKAKMEKATLSMRLAKASTLAHQRFGDSAAAEAGDSEKAALAEALQLLSHVEEAASALGNDSMTFECLKMKLQVCIQAEDAAQARTVLTTLQGLRPGDDDLKDDSARLNRMEAAIALKKGSGTIENMQKDLQEANKVVADADADADAKAKAKDAIKEALAGILDLMKTDQVKWDTVRTLKVGKDVGNSMKLGDADLAGEARKVVGEIQALAQRNAIGL